MGPFPGKYNGRQMTENHIPTKGIPMLITELLIWKFISKMLSLLVIKSLITKNSVIRLEIGQDSCALRIIGATWNIWVYVKNSPLKTAKRYSM
jgi:hypothetical protein